MDSESEQQHHMGGDDDDDDEEDDGWGGEQGRHRQGASVAGCARHKQAQTHTQWREERDKCMACLI